MKNQTCFPKIGSVFNPSIRSQVFYFNSELELGVFFDIVLLLI